MDPSNAYVPTTPARPEVTRREIGQPDAYMGVGAMPPQMSILGLPPQSTDAAAMIEMLRREMERQRNAPPTLMGSGG